MAASEHYRRQVGLLIRVLPLVAEENVFALKGGTAINLFIRDLPRLSVHVDLTYLPVAGRPESLADIDTAMKRIAGRVRAGLPGTRVHEAILVNDGAVNKLFVRDGDVQVKIEVTPVTRGCVYDPERRKVSARVEAEFGFAETQLVSFADLYAGKLVGCGSSSPTDFSPVHRRFLLADGPFGALCAGTSAHGPFFGQPDRPDQRCLGASIRPTGLPLDIRGAFW